MLVLDDPEGADCLVDQAVAQEHAARPVVVLMSRASEADLALQILRAFGKRTDLSGQATYVEPLWRNVRLWRDVLSVERLTVANSEFLNPAALRRLARLPDVLLIHDPKGATAELNEALHDVTRPAASYLTEQERPEASKLPPGGPPFPACPTDAFPFFLPTCRQVLSAEHHETVAKEYERTGAAVGGWHHYDADPDDADPHETAARLIRRILEPITDSHQRLAAARGVEHAFFDAGWLLRVDPARFMQATPHMPLPDIATRVNWYANTELAATAALASIGLDSAVLCGLSVDSVFWQSDDSHAVLAEVQRETPVRIPDELHTALNAFWIDRHKSLPIPNTGPLFRARDGGRVAAKTIQARLGRIALETGLPVASHWTPPADQRATRWMRLHGISLAKL
jgi:hypothetical protein